MIDTRPHILDCDGGQPKYIPGKAQAQERRNSDEKNYKKSNTAYKYPRSMNREPRV